MVKPLTIDLALPLYAELPTNEVKESEIERDYETGTASEAYGLLEVSLQSVLPSSEKSTDLFVRG